MKYLQAIAAQSILWAGVYFGVLKGIGPVANLLGVALFLFSLMSIAVSLGCHWIFDTEYNRIQYAFDKSYLGKVGNLLLKMSSISISVILIMMGNGWLILGVLFTIAILLQESVKTRLDKQKINNNLVS